MGGGDLYTFSRGFLGKKTPLEYKIDQSNKSCSQGGIHLKMGYGYVLLLRPLFTPSQLLPKTPISFFSSSRQICLNSQIWRIFISQPQTWGKVQFLTSRFGQISISRASNLTKTQFFKTPNLAAVHSLNPQFWPCGPHTHTKMKVEYPLGHVIYCDYHKQRIQI